jgi:hypothetical protein
MTDRKVILLLCTVILVLGAGVVVGRLLAPLPAAAIVQTQPDRPRPPWFDQLALSSQQRQQMDAIWDDTRQKLHNLNFLDHRRELDKQRDAQIRGLLSTSQVAAYDQINTDFRAKVDELDKERQKLIDDANQRSRALLDDSQKKLWDEQSKRPHGQDHGPHGPDHGPHGGPDGGAPTTRPWPGPPPMGGHF